MPAPSQQIPIPVMPGTEVTPSQINTSTPFTAQLAQPAFDPGPIHTSGRGGPGEALLAFANNFLAGASQGRLRQFQQSEVAKRQHEINYDATVQHIMDSPNYSRDFKEKVFQQSLATKAGAGLSALGGGKGSKNDHPLIGLARSVFSSAVGPAENKDHIDIGPEHVSDLITQMNQPEHQFNAADAIANTETKLNAAIKGAQEQAKSKGVPLYQQDVLNHPDVIAALQPLRREGIEPLATPGIQAALNQVAPRPTAQQQIDLTKGQAEADYHKAQAAYWRSKSGSPIPWTWTDEKGQPQTGSIVKLPDGSFADINGEAIQPTDPRLKGRPIGAIDVAGVRNAPVTTVTEHAIPQEGGGIAAVPLWSTRFRGTVPPPGAVVIPPVAPGQPGVQQLASKNNNPGNLEFRGQPGAVVSEDGRFAKFPTPEAGFRAIIDNVEANKKSPLTLEGYIHKYAPAGENNDPKTYAKNAATALGVPLDTPLANIDSTKLAQFQAHQESGTQVNTGTNAGTPPPAKIIGKKESPAGTGATLTPDAVLNAANRYHQSGELPYLSRGAAGDVQRAMIINKEAELYPGSNVAVNKAIYAGLKSSLAKTQAQASLVNSFENTGAANLDIAVANSNKVDRTNRPVINRYLLKLKGDYQGDTDTALFENAVMTAATEYARVISSLTGQTSKDVRDETRAMLNTAMSKGTFPAVAAQMKQEMNNRRTGYTDQIKELTTALARGNSTDTPAKNKIVVNVPGGTVEFDTQEEANAYKKSAKLP